jgi:hypothetical protein
MEDLVLNFSNHLNKMISNNLGNQIKKLLNEKKYENENDYASLENNVKNTIKNYLENCNENDLYEISKNIFNSFVDKDDENIIKAVKFLIKTYSFYSEMNLRKKLNQWRFNIIDDDNNNFKNKKRSNSKNKNEIKKNNNNVFEKLYKDSYKKNNKKK